MGCLCGYVRCQLWKVSSCSCTWGQKITSEIALQTPSPTHPVLFICYLCRFLLVLEVWWLASSCPVWVALLKKNRRALWMGWRCRGCNCKETVFFSEFLVLQKTLQIPSLPPPKQAFDCVWHPHFLFACILTMLDENGWEKRACGHTRRICSTVLIILDENG